MDKKRLHTLRTRAIVAVANLPRARVLALLLIVVVPGGFVVPATRYTRRSATR